MIFFYAGTNLLSLQCFGKGCYSPYNFEWYVKALTNIFIQIGSLRGLTL